MHAEFRGRKTKYLDKPIKRNSDRRETVAEAVARGVQIQQIPFGVMTKFEGKINGKYDASEWFNRPRG